MQRTDFAEIFMEKFSSFPLTWENVFRGTEYLDKTKKEVVDLVFLLRNEGIFISLKCQEDPDKRSDIKLANWILLDNNSQTVINTGPDNNYDEKKR